MGRVHLGVRVVVAGSELRRRSVHSTSNRPKRRGQSLTEFALVAPLLFLIIAVTIDFARLVYVYGAISSISREGARTASLKDQDSSDCLIFQSMEAGGAGGFNLQADPNSQRGDSDPNSPPGPLSPTTPTPGQGFIYVFPAVASGSPPDSAANCGGNGSSRFVTPSIRDVTVEVQYGFRPWVSVVASFIPPITIKTVSIVQREY